MLKFYDVETAQKTILRRTNGAGIEYSSTLITRTEDIFGKGVTPPEAVRQILISVQTGGDEAVRHWTNRLDRQRNRHDIIEQPDNDGLQIPADILEKAYQALPQKLSGALRQAADRIRKFHEFQPLPDWKTKTLGGYLGQRARPVDRVGIYVPGGTAPLPSSLLMSAIPAQVAGVRQIIVCTPPLVNQPYPHPVILAAAHLCGIETVFQVGGAQAIAAMAYGTESIPRVDKIVGAGNLFVTLAKQQVFGIVGLDGLAGPTETMVIADETANPAWVAADMLAQAEHDILASAILLTPSIRLAEAVRVEISRQLETLSREEIILQSLAHRGGIVIVPDLETAASLASEYAPEHLCLAVSAPASLADRIDHAGGLFLGEGSFEVLGDYVAGPSHVMPTGGTARFASPLNVYDFIKITSIIALDEDTSRELSSLAVTIAESETLTAHAAAAALRTTGKMKRDQ
jgi:histidinol dehydrogenase